MLMPRAFEILIMVSDKLHHLSGGKWKTERQAYAKEITNHIKLCH